MATLQEISAADELAISLEKVGIALGYEAIAKIKKDAANGSLSELYLKSTFFELTNKSLGKLWAPEMDFIAKSLSAKNQLITVAPLRWPALYSSHQDIATKILQTGTVDHAVELGPALNEVVTRQVDDTQDEATRTKIYPWKRYLNPGACNWCFQQIDIYENSRVWLRHANCRCFKVKRD